MYLVFRKLTLICLICLLLSSIAKLQPEDQPAPELLYRFENQLILVNAYTGEQTPLSLTVTEHDYIRWSPQGDHVLVMSSDADTPATHCLNFYDVDANAWIYPEPIACAVGLPPLYNSDGTALFFTQLIGDNSALWRFDFEADAKQVLFETTEGSELRPIILDRLVWSPSQQFLTFVEATVIMGGTVNSFVVMNMQSMEYFYVYAPNAYYANFPVVWSPDEKWFLVSLKKEYVTSGTLPFTNHNADIYLVNTDNGDRQRLTYSPTLLKTNIGWTEDGEITYTVIEENNIVLSVEQALKIEPLADGDIVTPEPFNQEDFQPRAANYYISPDPDVNARIQANASDEGYPYQLIIQSPWNQSVVPISRQIEDMIGWRPSDYNYPQG